MSMKHATDADSLFITLAEDLKTPLTRIAYHAEVAALANDHAADIQFQANQALQLLDAYLLGIKGVQQTALVLEPIHPAAALTDAAYALQESAKKFSCKVILEPSTYQGFALSHKQALTAVVTRLGSVFVEAQRAMSHQHKQVTLATYKTTKGVAVGVFHEEPTHAFSEELLATAHSHIGEAARPLAGYASGASAQLFVAEQLLRALQCKLRTARRGKLYGLAFDLQPTQQLQLV